MAMGSRNASSAMKKLAAPVSNPETHMAKKRTVGDVAEYMVARLKEAEGNAIELVQVHNDYLNWCREMRMP